MGVRMTRSFFSTENQPGSQLVPPATMQLCKSFVLTLPLHGEVNQRGNELYYPYNKVYHDFVVKTIKILK